MLFSLHAGLLFQVLAPEPLPSVSRNRAELSSCLSRCTLSTSGAGLRWTARRLSTSARRRAGRPRCLLRRCREGIESHLLSLSLDQRIVEHSHRKCNPVIALQIEPVRDRASLPNNLRTQLDYRNRETRKSMEMQIERIWA